MDIRRADLSIYEVPEGLRVSDRKITYLDKRSIDSTKSETKSKRKVKKYKAKNTQTGETFIGTSKQIGDKIFPHLATASQIGAVHALYKGKYNNNAGWIIKDIDIVK